jgi:hypothetical protein
MSQFYIELTLRSNVNDIFYTLGTSAGTVSNVAINNVSYEAQLVDFGPEIISRLRDAVMAQGGGKVFVSSATYQVSQLASNSAQMNLTVSTRARSVKGIAHIVRLATQQAGTLAIDCDASIYDSTSEYYLLANGSRYPQTSLTNSNDIRRHLEYYMGKPLRGIGGIRNNFITNNVEPGAGIAVGSSMFALDLESKSGSDFIESGYNSSLGSSQITINHTQATAQAKLITVITHVDCIFIVDALTKDVSVSI